MKLSDLERVRLGLLENPYEGSMDHRPDISQSSLCTRWMFCTRMDGLRWDVNTRMQCAHPRQLTPSSLIRPPQNRTLGAPTIQVYTIHGNHFLQSSTMLIPYHDCEFCYLGVWTETTSKEERMMFLLCKFWMYILGRIYYPCKRKMASTNRRLVLRSPSPSQHSTVQPPLTSHAPYHLPQKATKREKRNTQSPYPHSKPSNLPGRAHLPQNSIPMLETSTRKYCGVSAGLPNPLSLSRATVPTIAAPC
jgi:hypothetical protein